MRTQAHLSRPLVSGGASSRGLKKLAQLATLAIVLIAAQATHLGADPDARASNQALMDSFLNSSQVKALGGSPVLSTARFVRTPGTAEVGIVVDFDFDDRLVHRVVAAGEGSDVRTFDFVIFEGSSQVFEDASRATGWLLVRDLNGRHPTSRVVLEDGIVTLRDPETPQPSVGNQVTRGWLCDGCKAIASRGGKRCPGVCDALWWPPCCYCYMALCAYSAG